MIRDDRGRAEVRRMRIWYVVSNIDKRGRAESISKSVMSLYHVKQLIFAVNDMSNSVAINEWILISYTK